MAKTSTATQDGVVDLTEKTTVIGTGKFHNMPEGELFEVHPILAENLIKKGFAKKGKQ